MLSESLESRLDASLKALRLVMQQRDLLHSLVAEMVKVSCPTTDDRIGFMLHVKADLLERAKAAVQ